MLARATEKMSGVSVRKIAMRRELTDDDILGVGKGTQPGRYSIHLAAPDGGHNDEFYFFEDDDYKSWKTQNDGVGIAAVDDMLAKLRKQWGDNYVPIMLAPPGYSVINLFHYPDDAAKFGIRGFPATGEGAMLHL